MGRVSRDGIQCAYHGLVYSPAGDCISSSAAPPCRAYAVCESAGIVFAADTPSPAPLELGIDQNRVAYAFSDTVAANAFNVIDNLFDTAHLGIVHANSFSDGSACRDINFSARRDGFELCYALDIDPNGSFFELARGATMARVLTRYLPPLGQVFHVRYDNGLVYGSIQWLCPLSGESARLIQTGFVDDPAHLSFGPRLKAADWDIWLEDKAILETIEGGFIEDLILNDAPVADLEPHSRHIVEAARRTVERGPAE